jgi:hypothetical protein
MNTKHDGREPKTTPQPADPAVMNNGPPPTSQKTQKLRDEIETWVNEGGAGDDLAS